MKKRELRFLNELRIPNFAKIRQEELGMSHPHTIISRSNLGAAMASMLLQENANKNGLKTSDRKTAEELGSIVCIPPNLQRLDGKQQSNI